MATLQAEAIGGKDWLRAMLPQPALITWELPPREGHPPAGSVAETLRNRLALPELIGTFDYLTFIRSNHTPSP
ncbi:hypothetical protein [Thermogemmatispora sp.]|uniref:hypothetical protein n=1 Tax=Thermogemmatispora sp. TaxID=1968838 RepID=UPI001DFEC57E|nr:hypothetical protein [Thermogemmatispora sp.]MBX5450844.1 hypothetical protein [Thermogemmatispora sp.]